MDTPNANRSFKLQPIVLAIHLALAGAALAEPAPNELPMGGQVVSGQAVIQQSGGQMDIQQNSARVALDWHTFNIGSQAQVNFQQPDANSVALNRVAAGNASVIEGKLTANGQVFLVNPSGVLFGSGAQVDVGGLVATTMNISNKDFADGNYRFTRDGSTGEVINQGQIRAANGGYIALVAATVRNEGTIQANGGGTVVLAAGDGARLEFGDGRLMNIKVDPATVKTLIENKQLVQAQDGRVLMTAVAASKLQGAVINNAGAVEANSIKSEGGVIRLTGADEIGNTGTLDASGKMAGGMVEIDAGFKVSQAGFVKVEGSEGKGGRISLAAHENIENTGTLDAIGTTAGGEVELTADTSHIVSSEPTLEDAPTPLVRQAGTIKADASEGKGGRVVLTGEHLQLDDGSLTTATGASGGGEIYAGGGNQGKDPSIRNAKSTRIEKGAVLDASATEDGDGGTIVAWGEEASRAYGEFRARGGSKGGNGGLVETSGHWLDANGIKLDTTSHLGKGGTWLLDPYDVQVTAGAAGVPTNGSWISGVFTPNNTPSSITAGTINQQLNTGGNVTINTTGVGIEDGNIQVNASANISRTLGGATPAILTFNAQGSIVTLANITGTNTAPLDIVFNSGLNPSIGTAPHPGVASISIGGTMNTGGGSVKLTSGSAASSGITNGAITVNKSITTTGAAGGGEVSINSFANSGQSTFRVGPNSTITSGGGAITIATHSGTGNAYIQTDSSAQILSKGGGITLSTQTGTSGDSSMTLSGTIDSSVGGLGVGGGNDILFTTQSGVDSPAQITVSNGTSVYTGGGKLSILTDDTGTSRLGAITLGGSLFSNGGIITLGGGTGGYADNSADATLSAITTTNVTARIDASGTSGTGGNIIMRGISANPASTITFASSTTNILTNNSGTILIDGQNNAGDGIQLNSGNVNVQSSTGGITLTGTTTNVNSSGISNTGNISPIRITSSTGTITLDGTAPIGSIGAGVDFTDGGNNDGSVQISTTGVSGDINIRSLGGSATGINMAGTVSDITTAGGNVNLNAGIGDLKFAGTMTAAGVGTVNLLAQRDINFGIAPINTTSISTQGQAILLASDTDGNGIGGISLFGTNINSNGGNITLGGGNITGTGFAGGLSSTANYIAGGTPGLKAISIGSGSTLNSGGGNLTLRGQSNGAGANAEGIELTTASGTDNINLTTSGAGQISLNGIGSTASNANNNYGVHLAASGGRTVSISQTGTGAVNVTGTGGGSGGGLNTNHGVFYEGVTSSSISTASGDVFLTGTSGVGVGSAGISSGVGSTANIFSSSGNVIVAGNANAAGQTAINFNGSARLGTNGATTTTGNVSVTGGGTQGGITFADATSQIQTAGSGTIDLNAQTGLLSLQGATQTDRGNITFTADSMEFPSPVLNSVRSINAATPGHLLMQAFTANKTFGIGTGATGDIKLATGLFNGANQVFRTGFDYIQIGNTTSTGGITVNADTTVNDHLRLVQNSGNVNFNDGTRLTLNNSKNLTLQTNASGSDNTTGAITANGLELRGTGNYTLDSGSHQIVTISANNIGSVNLYNNAALTVGTVNTTNGLSSTGAVVLRTTSGNDITLGPTGQITSNAAGDAVVLASGRNFINNFGAAGISLPAGPRWLVYSNRPQDDTFNALNSANFAVWNTTYNPLANVTETGNRYVFAFQPTLTFTGNGTALNPLTKTYGQTFDASAQFTVTDFYNGKGVSTDPAFTKDVATQAYNGTPTGSSLGAGAGATRSGGNIAPPSNRYTLNVLGVAALTGNPYDLQFVAGELDINALGLTVTASRSYDGSTIFQNQTPAGAGFANFATINGINGDQLNVNSLGVGATVLSKDANVLPQALGGLANLTLVGIGTADANNYKIDSGNGTITPLALLGAITANNKAYDGNTAAVIASRTLTGVIGL